MDKHKEILDIMAVMLEKKDTRTIGKLGEKHPALYRLIRHIGHERISVFMGEGHLGGIDVFLPMDDKELRRIYEAAKKTELEKKEIQHEISKVKAHVREKVYLKLEKFYKSKAGGYGLKKILETSLAGCGVADASSDHKIVLLSYLDAYQTSLAKLEVSTHKKILMDFIRNEMTSYECEILIESGGVLRNG